MFTPREIPSIQQSYFAALAEANSGIIDISEGSLVNTLSRGNAALAASQDLRLRDLSRASYLSTATGSDLDKWAASFGIKRLGATPSFGYVLAISQSSQTIVVNNTVLTDLKSGVQLAIDQKSSITVLDYTEVPIPVRSTRLGASTRLSAGTEVFSPKYPQVSFIIGYSRSISGEYCGSLTGGQDKESDWDFSRRIGETLTALGSSSSLRLKLELERHPLVSKAYVITRIPGLIEVWVDSLNTLSQSQLSELQRYIADYTAAGTLISIGLINRKSIDVEIYVQPFVNSNLDSLTDQISSATKYLFDSLNIGETFSVDTLKSSLSGLARTITINTPASNVIPQPYELITYRAIDIVYATQS